MLALWTVRALSAGGLGVIGWQFGLYISELSVEREVFLPWASRWPWPVSLSGES